VNNKDAYLVTRKEECKRKNEKKRLSHGAGETPPVAIGNWDGVFACTHGQLLVSFRTD
jgi:hypothetical protein